MKLVNFCGVVIIIIVIIFIIIVIVECHLCLLNKILISVLIFPKGTILRNRKIFLLFTLVSLVVFSIKIKFVCFSISLLIGAFKGHVHIICRRIFMNDGSLPVFPGSHWVAFPVTSSSQLEALCPYSSSLQPLG